MGPDPYEEEMDDVGLDDERECHWMMVFKDNEGLVDDNKLVIHAKRLDVSNKGWVLCVSTSFLGEKVIW